MTGRALAIGTAILALLDASCARRTPAPTATGAPSATAVSSGSAIAPGSAAAPSAIPPPSSSVTTETAPEFVPAKSCRAIAVKGSVERNGAAIKTGDVLDTPAWLELSNGATLVVKHAETARELTFFGPGRVLPCDRGEERFFVTRGRVGTQTGGGARPGAEVLIATPLGAVRYGDARLDVRVDARSLRVHAENGDAWIDGAGPESTTQKVAAGGTAERRAPALDVKALVAQCTAAAASAEAHARDVLTPTNAPSPLGVRAAAHVRARQAARAACAIAAAALGTLEKGQNHDDLTQAVAAGEVLWRGVPSRRRPPQKVESR